MKYLKNIWKAGMRIPQRRRKKLLFPGYASVLLSSVALIGICGCGSPVYEKENSAYIVMKTPSFRYADMGFVYENRHEVKIEIYGNGQPVMQLRIGETSVCMRRFECMEKKRFNKKLLSRFYPDTLLEHIFRGEELFNGLNRKQIRNGFTQNIIKSDKYDITYRVLNNETVFRDTINHIIIKVKRMK